MRTLYKILVFILVLALILVAVLGIGAYVIYQKYLAPVPAELELSQSVDSIANLQIVTVKGLTTGTPEYIPVAAVSDVDAFLADFGGLDCYEGMVLSTIARLGELDNLSGIQIIYSDGTVEVITAYGNVNSTLFSPDTGITDLLGERFYFFTETDFNALLDKYK